VSALLEERSVQLRILAETVETLQAGEPGEKEQRVVSLTAQLTAAHADTAGLQREQEKQRAATQAALGAAATAQAAAEAARRTLAHRDAAAAAAEGKLQLASQVRKKGKKEGERERGVWQLGGARAGAAAVRRAADGWDGPAREAGGGGGCGGGGGDFE
jgi:hypothetical protein